MILCDIGNTTFHFKNGKKMYRVFVDGKKDDFPKFKKTVYYISVNDKATNKLKDIYKNCIDISKIYKFKTKYKGLGIDRQVVCSSVQNGIIIDAGSAVTVDIIKNGIHKGGFILPGLNALKVIYPKISKKLLFEFKNEVNLDKIPLKTNDAINYAILSAIVDPIVKVYEKFNLPLYFTGGDGKILYKSIENIPKIYEKDLIFKSMKKIIKNNKKGNRC